MEFLPSVYDDPTKCFGDNSVACIVVASYGSSSLIDIQNIIKSLPKEATKIAFLQEAQAVRSFTLGNINTEAEINQQAKDIYCFQKRFNYVIMESKEIAEQFLENYEQWLTLWTISK
jgi:hypothetical protein